MPVLGCRTTMKDAAASEREHQTSALFKRGEMNYASGYSTRRSARATPLLPLEMVPLLRTFAQPPGHPTLARYLMHSVGGHPEADGEGSRCGLAAIGQHATMTTSGCIRRASAVTFYGRGPRQRASVQPLRDLPHGCTLLIAPTTYPIPHRARSRRPQDPIGLARQIDTGAVTPPVAHRSSRRSSRPRGGTRIWPCRTLDGAWEQA